MLAQFYPPLPGGEERHVRDLSIELTKRGHKVSIATLWHKGMQPFSVDQGVRVYRIRATMPRIDLLFKNAGTRHSPPFPDPEALLELKRIIMEEKPQIIHAHNWLLHSFTPLKAWTKAKFVVTLHDCSFICPEQQLLKRGMLCSGPGMLKCLDCSIEHYGFKGTPLPLLHSFWSGIERHTVDMFLSVSQAIADISQLPKYKLRYRVIPNFIPDEVNEVPPDEDSPHLSQLPRGDYLLFVGDIGHSKGTDVLLQAYSDMKHQIPLVLIGRSVGELASPVPPNVHFLSSWPHAAVMSAWGRCSLALIPSICFDACPTVAMEAMLMGRPIIASNIGGIPEIVKDGETGLLVKPGNADELRQAMLRLLNDSSLRERMGEAAAQRIVHFQSRTVVPRIEQAYQEVLRA